MPKAKTRAITAPPVLATFVAPELPDLRPKVEAGPTSEPDFATRLNELSRHLEQRNLDTAVLLAQQAARRRGPLVDHFMELGRLHGNLLDAPQTPKLRLIKGLV